MHRHITNAYHISHLTSHIITSHIITSTIITSQTPDPTTPIIMSELGGACSCSGGDMWRASQQDQVRLRLLLLSDMSVMASHELAIFFRLKFSGLGR